MKIATKHPPGFQLIEVMMTLVLIAILSHFLFVNYQSAIAAEKRHLAEIALIELGSQLEEYAMNNMTYEGATLKKLKVDEYAAKKSYLLKIDTINTHDYSISAHPLLNQAKIDQSCGVLSLSSTGTKRVSGTGSITACW